MLMKVDFKSYVFLSSLSTVFMMKYIFDLHHQFYPMVVHITKSKACYMVVINQAFVLSILLIRLIKSIFLGTLRDQEMEQLTERFSITIMDTLLSMTIFRDEFNLKFVAFFGLLLSIKMFHWLSSDRVDFISQSPARSIHTYIRIFLLMVMCLSLDVGLLYFSGKRAINESPSMMMLFAFEYMILFFSIISIMIKFGFNMYDIYNREWEDRSVAVLYLDFIVDTLQLVIYLLFFGTIFHFYGLPLHLIRQVWITFKSFQSRVKLLLRYRRATQDMNQRFPEAPEDILNNTDKICIVCRYEMDNGRVIPCGHILHERCLKGWLQQTQTCPICRFSVLIEELQPHQIKYPQLFQNYRPNVNQNFNQFGFNMPPNNNGPINPFINPMQFQNMPQFGNQPNNNIPPQFGNQPNMPPQFGNPNNNIPPQFGNQPNIPPQFGNQIPHQHPHQHPHHPGHHHHGHSGNTQTQPNNPPTNQQTNPTTQANTNQNTQDKNNNQTNNSNTQPNTNISLKSSSDRLTNSQSISLSSSNNPITNNNQGVEDQIANALVQVDTLRDQVAMIAMNLDGLYNSLSDALYRPKQTDSPNNQDELRKIRLKRFTQSDTTEEKS